MKITVNRDNLLKTLDIVSNALVSKALVSSYNYFMFDVIGDKCYVYARNGEMQIKAFVTVKSSEDFKFCIPGSKLTETVRLIEAEDVILTTKEEENGSLTTTLTVKGAKNRYKNSGINPSDFAMIKVGDIVKDTTVPMADFIKHISKACIPTDKNNLVQSLGGVSITSVDGKLTIIGANSNYMYKGLIDSTEEIPDIIIGKSTATFLSVMPIAPEITINSDSRYIIMKSGSVEVTSILINEKYPQTSQFYTRYEKDKYISINRQALIKSMKVLRLYSTKENKAMNIVVSDNEMKISGEDLSMTSSAEEVLEVENSGIENDFCISLNPTFVLTSISNLDTDNIRLHFVAQDCFVYITDESEFDNDFWLVAPIYNPKE